MGTRERVSRERTDLGYRHRHRPLLSNANQAFHSRRCRHEDKANDLSWEKRRWSSHVAGGHHGSRRGIHGFRGSASRDWRQDRTKHRRLRNTASRNSSFNFRLQSKVFTFFYSFYNEVFCISERGLKRGRKKFHLWFDKAGIEWILDSLTRISNTHSMAHFRFEVNRKLELSYKSNYWGDYISLQESRIEGHRSCIIIPLARKRAPPSFISALSKFFERANSQVSLHKEPNLVVNHCPASSVWRDIPQGVNVLPPTTLDEGTRDFQDQGREEELDRVEDEGPHLISLEVGQIELSTTKESHNDQCRIGGNAPIPKLLSPLAKEFIPQSNPFNSLMHLETSQVMTVTEDPFEHFEEKSLVFLSNALEERMSPRDEPNWYNHTDVEDEPFFVSKLKPIAVDLSHCSKISLQMPKRFKRRDLFSPSQIVTRSKAKVLALSESIIKYDSESDDEEKIDWVCALDARKQIVSCPQAPKPKKKGRQRSKSQKKKMKTNHYN